MTDNTQPEALRLADDLEASSHFPGNMRSCNNAAAAELRRQHARIAELEAVGAGGVQALGVAPEAIAKLRHLYKNLMCNGVRGTEDAKRIAEGLLAPAIEALERATPPAEQQATKETSGGFHVWRDISTAPKDGSRFVATGHNYGLYSEVRHTCVAQWFRGCWMEASDWNETSELKYLTHWMPLPSPPDDVAAPAEQQAEESCVKLLAECRDAFPIPEPSSPLEVQWSAAMARPEEVPEYVRLCVAAMQAAPKAAPSVEYATMKAQNDQFEHALAELVDLICPGLDTGNLLVDAKTAGDAALALHTKLAAPQPAPAPLSEREAFERDWEKRHAPAPINSRTRDDGRYGDSSIQDAWESWQARAALAAQGGKV